MVIDPETSIDWKRAAAEYAVYASRERLDSQNDRYEYELDWPSVWIREVLPRLRAALLLEKHVAMGLIAPSNAEIVARFLRAFVNETTVILPDEQRHFLQTWKDIERRPRTWGSRLMGWQNTFWIRLLLRGLAAELGVKTVKVPTLSVLKHRRTHGLAMREAKAKTGKAFIEVFFGRWAELNEAEDIVAMYRVTDVDERGYVLTCDRSSKVCGKGLHDCDMSVRLASDVHGRQLSSWIAQDKLKKPVTRSSKNAVLFFTGTLAPFHHGHLDMLNAAKAHLERQGWHVIGGYAAPLAHLKEGRLEPELEPILASGQTRSDIVQLGVMMSDWLMADTPIEHVLRASQLDDGNHPTQMIVKRLRQCGAVGERQQVTTFWVNGKDAYLQPDFFQAFASVAQSDPLNPLRMLIVDNRPGKDEWSVSRLARDVPCIASYIQRVRYHQKRHSSATAVRRALLDADRLALCDAVGAPLIEAYLMGCMHMAVR